MQYGNSYRDTTSCGFVWLCGFFNLREKVKEGQIFVLLGCYRENAYFPLA
jgi:hypothetical protein